MIQILEARKAFNGTLVLDIPGLELPGGLYWLQGVNGSGKSTLLRMMAGMVPFEGDIRVNGVSLRNSPVPYRKQVSWAAAEPLYPLFLTGRELLRLYQAIRKARHSQVDHLVNLFGMEQWLSSRIGSYSSGMVKRLSLVLALLGNTSLILLDEPLATLDADAAALLPSLVRDFRKDQGTSFIFSSHQAFKPGDLPVDRSLVIAGQKIRFSP
jgi:ABC-2 type transport system ATP-binding protein